MNIRSERKTMANIAKRGKTWQARLDYYDDSGKRHFKSKSGFKTKKQAQLFVSKMIVDKSSGKFIPEKPPLFYEYFWQWFETYKEKTIVDRTKRQYVHTYNVLKELMPTVKLDKINREVYQKFLDEYGKNHAKETISKVNALVHACIKDAIYDGKIQKDFVQRTNIVYDKSKTWKIDYLNELEMKQLTNLIVNSLNHHFTSKYMILLAIYTGMRLGEIQGLKWSDINFNFKTINVHRSWNALTKEYIPTKTESSDRVIRVNDEVLEILKDLQKNDSDVVFINQFGTIPTSNAVNKTLRNCLEQLNINKQGFHFHSLRHTHVAYLLAHDVDIYVISKRLGHSNVSTTTNVYSYLIDEYKTRANDHIESILNNLNEDTKKDAKIN